MSVVWLHSNLCMGKKPLSMPKIHAGVYWIICKTHLSVPYTGFSIRFGKEGIEKENVSKQELSRLILTVTRAMGC